ncbi:hypothetical protein N7495_003563 [Penicillium taxi]|uniref:uncharacterized protein n=1 Tax=Penicillium taxi TaxID=168475 RepID=UPI0025454A4C|nr:uncharacterized protein N7495_003563 [Penicillium taxi]KAJ5898819.1 hypothetical protein N7495_003563 [Penicillium taxi]
MDDSSHYSIRIWSNGQDSDHSTFPIYEERNCVHAEACTISKPLLAHAVSLPPRSFGVTGALSLHEYRKNLAESAECVADLVDLSELKVRRKQAIKNLSRPQPIYIVPYAESISSTESSPPPLSPSYSNSILTQQSEQDYITELSLGTDPLQGPREYLVSANLTRPRQNRKRLNTFRQKLEEKAQARGQALDLPLSCPRTSDSMLANTQAVATISHGGASFEILNPRESLDVTRIVSFIEDVDNCSLFSGNRDQARVSSNSYSLDEGLSQFTDVSLPSHYSHSLYTPNSTGCSTPKRQIADIPSSSPGVYDRVRSLSDYSIHDYDYWRMVREQNNEHDNHTYHDLVDDPSNTRIASISEHADEDDDLNSDDLESSRPLSSSPPTFYSEESDIGEPGSPVYANGNWAQVDERDRGIFFEMPSPYDTYANTKSPSYAENHDAYDPIYFDPHVQSVLAAANAETMGLRGHSPRALDDMQQRGYHTSLAAGNGNTRKHSPSSRKRLRKLFSWRSGN